MIACAEWLNRDNTTCTRGTANCICRRDAVVAWLKERAANCARIASTKKGEHRAGWIEDMRYFKAAIAIINATSAHPPAARNKGG